MRYAIFLSAFLFVVTISLASARGLSRELDGFKKESIDVGGVERTYYVHVPPGTAEGRPIVLGFHGGGGTARGMEKLTSGFSRLADKEGFILVYPQGEGRHWNDGRTVNASKFDDVAFISALIDKIVKEFHADRSRVYATGISNGGFFSEYLAIKLSAKIAAVAPVAATLPDFYERFPSVPSMPIAFLLGTEDPLVPFGGGSVGGKLIRSRGKVVSAGDSVSFWLRANHVDQKPEVLDLPEHAKDGTSVQLKSYGDPTNPDVLVYEIRGGGHTWPQGWQYLPASLVGRTTKQFNANEVIWDFFKRHSKSI